MNTHDTYLMSCPSVPKQPYCPVCGKAGPLTEHHLVPRSRGGHDGPTIFLCGSGTTGCHGKAEDKMLHFDYFDPDFAEQKFLPHGWCWIETAVPTKQDDLDNCAWAPIHTYNECADDIPHEASEESGKTLWELTKQLEDLRTGIAGVAYYEGKVLLELRQLLHDEYGTREGNNRLAQLVLEQYHLKNVGAARTFITCHTAYSLLPETEAVTSLGVTRGYRVAKALKTNKKQLKDVLYDEAAMSVEDFDAVYFDKTPAVEKPRCVCSECGHDHPRREE